MSAKSFADKLQRDAGEASKGCDFCGNDGDGVHEPDCDADLYEKIPSKEPPLEQKHPRITILNFKGKTSSHLTGNIPEGLHLFVSETEMNEKIAQAYEESADAVDFDTSLEEGVVSRPRKFFGDMLRLRAKDIREGKSK